MDGTEEDKRCRTLFLRNLWMAPKLWMEMCLCPVLSWNLYLVFLPPVVIKLSYYSEEILIIFLIIQGCVLYTEWIIILWVNISLQFWRIGKSPKGTRWKPRHIRLWGRCKEQKVFQARIWEGKKTGKSYEESFEGKLQMWRNPGWQKAII